jgi:hypothetical protein
MEFKKWIHCLHIKLQWNIKCCVLISTAISTIRFYECSPIESELGCMLCKFDHLFQMGSWMACNWILKVNCRSLCFIKFFVIIYRNIFYDWNNPSHSIYHVNRATDIFRLVYITICLDLPIFWKGLQSWGQNTLLGKSIINVDPMLVFMYRTS